MRPTSARSAPRIEARPPGAIVLDRTYFYPNGGGQPADRGLLRRSEGGAWTVLDVQHRGDAVLHRVEERERPARPLAVGDELEGSIDWELRYRHMRAHTAQHLASSIVFDLTGIRTRRAAIGAVTSSIDLDQPLPSAGDLGAVRTSFEAKVAEDWPVSLRFVAREEYEASPSARAGLAPLPRSVVPGPADRDRGGRCGPLRW